jgi:hypothetical protein
MGVCIDVRRLLLKETKVIDKIYWECTSRRTGYAKL